MIRLNEDNKISFVDNTPLRNPDHPERLMVTEAQDLKRKTEELKKKVEVKPAEDIPIEGKEQNEVTQDSGKEVESEVDETIQKEALLEEAVHVSEEEKVVDETPKEESTEEVPEEIKEKEEKNG